MDKPVVQNAPGLAWRLRKKGWEAIWRPRHDFVKRGMPMQSVTLWKGWNCDEITARFISDKCNLLQDQMNEWVRETEESLPRVDYDGTLKGLSRAYQTDPDSTYRKLQHQTQLNYARMLGYIERDCGDTYVRTIRARDLKRWHEKWVGTDQKFTLAHELIGILRTMMTFGATMLECEHCRQARVLLHDMKFPTGRPRTERLTAEYAIAIRQTAHADGWPSVALAQAHQFECMLRQKDVIGEWLPVSEPGVSEVIDGNLKWLKGIRWEKIDSHLILRHRTSKRQKDHEVDLTLAPMVLEEFERMAPGLIVRDKDGNIVQINRDLLPAKGPIINQEGRDIPWRAPEFRRRWRLLATKAGVPKSVYNMDTRAGAISEATDSGADIEHVRHAATHSDIKMTSRYSRNARGKTDNVMKMRAEFRNKGGMK